MRGSALLVALGLLAAGAGCACAVREAPPESGASGGEVRATFVDGGGAVLLAVFDNAAGTVAVTLPGGREVTLPRAVSGSGARYSDGRETFWEHQGEATFTSGEEVLFEGRAEGR